MTLSIGRAAMLTALAIGAGVGAFFASTPAGADPVAQHASASLRPSPPATSTQQAHWERCQPAPWEVRKQL